MSEWAASPHRKSVMNAGTSMIAKDYVRYEAKATGLLDSKHPPLLVLSLALPPTN